MSATTIKDKDGNMLGHWVTKTSRGYNAVQRAEMAAVRKMIVNGESLLSYAIHYATARNWHGVSMVKRDGQHCVRLWTKQDTIGYVLESHKLTGLIRYLARFQ